MDAGYIILKLFGQGRKKLDLCRVFEKYNGHTVPSSRSHPSDIFTIADSQLQITNDDRPKLEQTIKYFKKQWLTRIAPEELSIFDVTRGTNNGAESYHRQLKFMDVPGVSACTPGLSINCNNNI